METLVEQPAVIEQIDRYVRRYNDVTTWFAEVLDGSMRTPFEYSYDGKELYSEDGGALGVIFDNAVEDARRFALEQPELAFELPRRLTEKSEYKDMLAMMRGDGPNTMVVTSEFPTELMQARHDVGGYNVTRKQTMLRVMTKDGQRLKMYSQTLDGSDREALLAIHAYFGSKPQNGELLGQRIHVDLAADKQAGLTDVLTAVYDKNLQQRFGGGWQAGRREMTHDTYAFVLGQPKLIDHIVQKDIAGNLGETDMYDMAALLTKRFEAAKNPQLGLDLAAEAIIFNHFQRHIEDELRQAGAQARQSGKVFSGCGASAGAGNLSGADQLDMAGYGNKSEKSREEDDYGPLTFKCKNGHINRRPRGRLISSCRVASCKNSVAC